MCGLLAIDGKGRCVDVNCKRRRRILAKLWGGTAALRIETGRWSGLKREERLCRQCRLEEVEDVEHFLLRCEGWAQEREVVTACMEDLAGESCTADDRKVALILDQACGNGKVYREGGREAVAVQISAEFPGLMSLAVPVVFVNRFSSDCPSRNDFT